MNIFSIPRSGTLPTLMLIYREDGVMRGLFRGLSINYMRAVPQVAISFCAYEKLKQAFNLETGMTIKPST